MNKLFVKPLMIVGLLSAHSLSFSQNQASSNGDGQEGGGGFVVYCPQGPRPRLLDYYELAKTKLELNAELKTDKSELENVDVILRALSKFDPQFAEKLRTMSREFYNSLQNPDPDYPIAITSKEIRHDPTRNNDTGSKWSPPEGCQFVPAVIRTLNPPRHHAKFEVNDDLLKEMDSIHSGGLILHEQLYRYANEELTGHLTSEFVRGFLRVISSQHFVTNYRMKDYIQLLRENKFQIPSKANPEPEYPDQVLEYTDGVNHFSVYIIARTGNGEGPYQSFIGLLQQAPVILKIRNNHKISIGNPDSPLDRNHELVNRVRKWIDYISRFNTHLDLYNLTSIPLGVPNDIDISNLVIIRDSLLSEAFVSPGATTKVPLPFNGEVLLKEKSWVRIFEDHVTAGTVEGHQSVPLKFFPNQRIPVTIPIGDNFSFKVPTFDVNVVSAFQTFDLPVSLGEMQFQNQTLPLKFYCSKGSCTVSRPETPPALLFGTATPFPGKRVQLLGPDQMVLGDKYVHSIVVKDDSVIPSRWDYLKADHINLQDLRLGYTIIKNAKIWAIEYLPRGDYKHEIFTVYFTFHPLIPMKDTHYEFKSRRMNVDVAIQNARNEALQACEERRTKLESQSAQNFWHEYDFLSKEFNRTRQFVIYGKKTYACNEPECRYHPAKGLGKNSSVTCKTTIQTNLVDP